MAEHHIRDHARDGGLARSGLYPDGAALTAAATAASPASLDYWRAQVLEEHPGAAARDVERMAKARQSLHFSKKAKRRWDGPTVTDAAGAGPG
jgi:hypothetical protein